MGGSPQPDGRRVAGTERTDTAAQVSATRHRSRWWYLLIATPWAIGAVFLAHQAIVDVAVAKRQHTTWGAVRSHEPHNHNSYGYSFTVGDQAFSGRDSPRGDDEWKIGQRVRVYYDSADPRVSALEDFDQLAFETAGPLSFLTAGAATIAIMIFVGQAVD